MFVVAALSGVTRTSRRTSSAHPPASATEHGRRLHPARRRGPHQASRHPPPLPPRAADAAETAADVLVDEAERGGHDRAEVGDGKQRQRNAEYRVEDRHCLSPLRLRRNVSIPCHSTAVKRRLVTLA